MLGPIDQALEKYQALGQEAPESLKRLQTELENVRKKTEGVSEGAGKAAQDTAKIGDSAGGIAGKLAPLAGAIAGVFSVQAVANFAKEIVNLGGQISDLSQRTGLSVTAVQELKFAADQTGTSIETVSGAVSKLGKGLVEGGQGTVQAVDALGLSFRDLQKMKPDEAFTQVAEAIAGIEDPMQQSAAAMALFGKAGVELLPAIKSGISDLRAEAQRLGVVLSEENVAALDAFGDKFDQTLLAAKVSVAKFVLDLPKAFALLGPAMAEGGWIQGLKSGISEAFLAIGRDGAASGFARGWAVGLANQTTEAKKALDDFQRQMADYARETAGGRGHSLLDLALGIEPGATPKVPKFKFISEEDRREAEAAAKAIAEEIKKLRDQLSGAALQGDIKKLDAAWKGLTDTQKASKQTIKDVVALLEGYRAAGGQLTPTLQKLYDEHRKLLPVITEVGDHFRKLIIVLPNLDRAAEQARNKMASLTKDGLIPTRAILTDLIPLIDTSGIVTNNLAGQFRNAARTAAELKAEAERLASMDLGEQFGEAIIPSLLTGEFSEAARQAGEVFVDALGKSIDDSLSGAAAGMDWSAFAQGLGKASATAIATMWIEGVIGIISGSTERAADARGSRARRRAWHSRPGLGGLAPFGRWRRRPACRMNRLRMRWGARRRVSNAGSAEITPELLAFQQALAGLGTAAGGTTDMTAGLAAQFAPAIAEQKRGARGDAQGHPRP